MADYKSLKSGTDIRGTAIDTGAGITITDEAVADLTRAFIFWLSTKFGGRRLRIAFGRDSRLSGERIMQAMLKCVRETDIEINECGVISTPALYMMTKFATTKCDGAIMITASHHPFDRNGLKFFTEEGGLNGKQLNEVIALAERKAAVSKRGGAQVIRRDYLRWYCDYLTSMAKDRTGLSLPFRGLKIAVDAGGGAAGFFAKRVLAPLGADVSCSQYLEPDGRFPYHVPNPEDEAAMESIKNRVVESNADFGIIFDADGDRSAIVTKDGSEVNRNRLIALASAIVLEDEPGATIVTDSEITVELEEFIKKSGGVCCRFKRGYRNVIDEAKRLESEGTKAPLAMETSGHAAFRENHYLDDGAYLVMKLLIKAAILAKDGKTLHSMIAELEEPLEEAHIRVSVGGEKWKELAETVLSRLENTCSNLLEKEDSVEGIRAYVSHAKAYFTVRKSVHDPSIVIYIESAREGGAASAARFLLSFMQGFRDLDISELSGYIDSKTNG